MGTALPPHPGPLPNTKNVLGEREQTVGTLTQGAALGYSDAPLGLHKEEVASCRFTDVQTP